MKKILCLLPSLLIMAALSGCCANNVCNCDDALADALFFKINYTSHRQRDASGRFISFNAKDVDTLRLYRTSRRPTDRDTVGFVRTTDSVTIVRVAGPLDGSPGDSVILSNVQATTTAGTTTLTNQDVIVINNASPFASTSTTKLSGYTYRIGVLSNGHNRRKPIAIYYVTGIKLDGRYDANGCCTCYQNTGKRDTLTYRLPVTARRPTSKDTVVGVNAADTLNRVVRLPYSRVR